MPRSSGGETQWPGWDFLENKHKGCESMGISQFKRFLIQNQLLIEWLEKGAVFAVTCSSILANHSLLFCPLKYNRRCNYPFRKNYLQSFYFKKLSSELTNLKASFLYVNNKINCNTEILCAVLFKFKYSNGEQPFCCPVSSSKSQHCTRWWVF